jgi:hypothetical protein
VVDFGWNEEADMIGKRMVLGTLLIAAVLLTSCVAPAAPAPAPSPVVITVLVPVQTMEEPTQVIQAEASATQALPSPPPPPTNTPAPNPSPTITATFAPLCSVKQDIFLRKGPGTAYDPPLTALASGTLFRPTAFNPVGIPGGPWVLAEVTGSSATGWVTAGEQYITCNLDLASLPSLQVDPPIAAAPQVAGGGLDGDNISSYKIAVLPSGKTLFEVIIYPVIEANDPDEAVDASKNGRGIDYIDVQITNLDTGQVVYTDKLRRPPYCMDCLGFVLENGVYKWWPRGEPVTPGKYQITAKVFPLDSEVGVGTLLIDFVVK